MATGSTISPASGAVLAAVGSHCRTGERIAMVYFAYTAILAYTHSLSPVRIVVASLIPFSIGGLAVTESRYPKQWSSILRDWLTLALVLLAYWQVDWFSAPPLLPWQQVWVGWDRMLLDRWRLRAGLEAFGWLIPTVLDASYLFLYAVPPLCIAAVYLHRRRDRVDPFLTTLFLGAFSAYALMPHFPTESPRMAFPGADLPSFSGLWRSVTVWLLDRLDISTSVFPSGHVAVAFSSAFGLRRALPEQRRLWSAFFAVAASVYVATIYCRYHYAADGLASIGIALLAWVVSEVCCRNA